MPSWFFSCSNKKNWTPCAFFAWRHCVSSHQFERFFFGCWVVPSSASGSFKIVLDVRSRLKPSLSSHPTTLSSLSLFFFSFHIRAVQNGMDGSWDALLGHHVVPTWHWKISPSVLQLIMIAQQLVDMLYSNICSCGCVWYFIRWKINPFFFFHLLAWMHIQVSVDQVGKLRCYTISADDQIDEFWHTQCPRCGLKIQAVSTIIMKGPEMTRARPSNPLI